MSTSDLVSLPPDRLKRSVWSGSLCFCKYLIVEYPLQAEELKLIQTHVKWISWIIRYTILNYSALIKLQKPLHVVQLSQQIHPKFSCFLKFFCISFFYHNWCHCHKWQWFRWAYTLTFPVVYDRIFKHLQYMNKSLYDVCTWNWFPVQSLWLDSFILLWHFSCMPDNSTRECSINAIFGWKVVHHELMNPIGFVLMNINEITG